MLIEKTYNDLRNEIQYYDLRIKQLNRVRRKLCAQTFHGPSGYSSNSGVDPTGIRGSLGYLPLDNGIERIQAVEDQIKECEEMMALLQEQIGEINALLYSLEGRKYKIFCLHKCENKSFAEIGKEVKLSAKQVQRIYKEVCGNE